MNWLDLVLALLLLASVISGLRKGLLRIGIGTAAALAGFLLAAWFYRLASAQLLPWIPSRLAADTCGFLLLFGGVLLAGALLSRLLAGLLSAVGLSWLDRSLGGVLGALRGLFIGAVLVLLLSVFSTRQPPPAVVESRVAPYVLGGARLLAAMAPHPLREGFRRSYARVTEVWKQTLSRPKRLPSREL